MSRQVGRQLPFPIGRDLRNPQTIPREPRRNPAIAQCRLETSPHTAWSEIKAMAGGPNPGPNQPGAWTSVSTPLGEHQKTTTPMEQPTTWIENPLRGTTNNITPKTTPCPRQRHTQDNCTTWALAIPRRGYFPQPGVVAHATTPGSHPHHDLYPVRIAFHTRLMIGDRSLSEPASKGTAFRVQVLWGIAFPGSPLGRQPGAERSNLDEVGGGLARGWSRRPRVVVPIVQGCRRPRSSAVPGGVRPGTPVVLQHAAEKSLG